MCHEFEEAVCKKGNNLVLDKITVAYFYYNTIYYLDKDSTSTYAAHIHSESSRGIFTFLT